MIRLSRYGYNQLTIHYDVVESRLYTYNIYFPSCTIDQLFTLPLISILCERRFCSNIQYRHYLSHIRFKIPLEFQTAYQYTHAHFQYRHYFSRIRLKIPLEAHTAYQYTHAHSQYRHYFSRFRLKIPLEVQTAYQYTHAHALFSSACVEQQNTPLLLGRNAVVSFRGKPNLYGDENPISKIHPSMKIEIFYESCADRKTGNQIYAEARLGMRKQARQIRDAKTSTAD